MTRLSILYGGRVVKFTGDGMMAVFRTTSNALISAREMVEAAHALNLAIRAGVHAGDVLNHEGDYSGTVVTIASRVADLAEAGEILTAGAVRGLVEGSDLTFIEHGQFDLKGLGQRTIIRLTE